MVASLVHEARIIFRHPHTTLDVGEIWLFFACIFFPPGVPRPLLTEYYVEGSTRNQKVIGVRSSIHHSPGPWDGYTLAVCSDGEHTVPVSFTASPSRDDESVIAYTRPAAPSRSTAMCSPS